MSPEGFAKRSNVDFRYNKGWELESDFVPITNMWFTLAINSKRQTALDTIIGKTVTVCLTESSHTGLTKAGLLFYGL